MVETRDNGSLLRSHRRSVMPRVGMNFRFFADKLRTLAHDDLEVRGHRERITWDPAGVCAIITPWNAPLMLARPGGSARALRRRQHRGVQAAGVDPADRVTARRYHRGGRPAARSVQRRAGHRRRGRRRADRTPGHPPVVVHRVGADGGRHRQGRGRPNIVPVSFELGGKSPLVVFADADFDLAVSLAVEQFDNAGQVCLGAFRILVESSLPTGSSTPYWPSAPQLRQGDPRDPDTDGQLPGLAPAFRAGVGLRRAREGTTALARCWAAAQRRARWPVLPPHDPDRRQARQRDRQGRGLRPGTHRADLRRRGNRRSRWPTTPGSGWPRRSSPATGSAPSESRRRCRRGPSG